MPDDAPRPTPPSWLSTSGSPDAPYGVAAEARQAAARARHERRAASPPASTAAKAQPRQRPARGAPAAQAGAILSDNARVVLERRYLAKDAAGNLTETPEQLFRRVANNIAQAETKFAPPAATENVAARYEAQFYDLMTSLRFLPNSPTLGNAGRAMQQLSACFVLPVDDSMEGIFGSLHDTALIHQSGGGTGFAFSRLRPAGDIVASTGGVASGPVSFMRVYDAATESIKQGGTRRGANMAILSVDHPDIEAFINIKSDMTTLQNFNISVAVTEGFMQAVERDDDYDLLNPRTRQPAGRRSARAIFRQIIANAWKNGDPGLVFLDRINHDNPTPQLGRIEATNPCVTGDTRIATARGLVRIDELYASHEDLAVVADRRGRFANAQGVDVLPAAPAFMTAPDADVFRVMTTHGYEVTATAWHTFVTDRGRVALRDLVVGDTLLIQSGEGAFGELGSRDLGIVLGSLAGDGNFHKQRGVVLSFWGDDKDYAADVCDAANRLIDRATPGNVATARRTIAPLAVPTRDRVDLRSVALGSVVQGHGVTAESKLRVPEVIWQGTRDAVAGYLQALFAADGTVNLAVAKKSCSVRLAQSDRRFLVEIQLLLANFGIESKVLLRRNAGSRMMPDGRGGSRLYPHRAQFGLLIDGESRDRFAREIGFLSPRKQAKLDAFIAGKSRTSNRSRFVTAVASITHAGKAPVYDTNEPATHTITANGIVTGQCGEQPLLPYESCNLGSINLARFVREHETAPAPRRNGKKRTVAPPAADVDWDALAAAIPLCVRFLDDVIEQNKYPIPAIDEMSRKTRKIGLGVMGWADLLFALRLRYDSDEAVALAGRMMSFIQEHADRASVALAAERGVFPAWHGSIYDPASGEDRAGPRYRNSTRTTIAPTGTLSIIADCSGGIEPAFALAFMRQHFLDRNDAAKATMLPEANRTFRTVAEREGFYSDELMTHLAEGGALADRDDVPAWAKDIFRTSHDIDPEWHVKMQAAFQRHTDNAVSKTINFRNDATVDDVERAYMLAYREGCKGITVYRDGSRDHQVLSHATVKGPEQAEAVAAEIAMSFAGLMPSGAHPAPLASTDPRPAGAPYRRHLPDERQSVTHKFRVGEQEGYVTVGLYDDGAPGEIFVNISKEGSTIRGLMDSVAVLTSVALQYGVPLENLVSKFRGVHFEPAGLTNNPRLPTASSLVDYIFRWLELRFLKTAPASSPAASTGDKPRRRSAVTASAATDAGEEPVADPPTSNIQHPTSAPSNLQPPTPTATSTGIGCPECGSILVFSEGCFACRNCGYSRC
jgi:ribonucleoside-diphosphate reductase alpha chain